MSSAPDRDGLDSAFEKAAGIPGMRSLLVDRGGGHLCEEYWNGARRDLIHDVRSVTKSVTSALVGIAIERGAIRSVHDPIGDYLGPILAGRDPWIGRTTLADLLTMRAGHAWDVFSDDEFRAWTSAADPLDYILEKPFVDAPGTRFNYSDGAAHLVSVALTEATGMPLVSFAEQQLFGPLGIDRRLLWNADARGYNGGGVGLRLRPAELLAFGSLFRAGGSVGGRQVVPEAWVKQSTHAQVGAADGVASREEPGGIVFGGSYGYFWWQGRAASSDFYFAKGHGGQYVVIDPELELVVVSTADADLPDRARVWRNEVDVLRLIVQDVLSAVRA